MSNQEIFEFVFVLISICLLCLIAFLMISKENKRLLKERVELKVFRENLLTELSLIGLSLSTLSTNYYKSESKYIDDYNHKAKEELKNGR